MWRAHRKYDWEGDLRLVFVFVRLERLRFAQYFVDLSSPVLIIEGLYSLSRFFPRPSSKPQRLVCIIYRKVAVTATYIARQLIDDRLDLAVLKCFFKVSIWVPRNLIFFPVPISLSRSPRQSRYLHHYIPRYPGSGA